VKPLVVGPRLDHPADSSSNASLRR